MALAVGFAPTCGLLHEASKTSAFDCSAKRELNLLNVWIVNVWIAVGLRPSSDGFVAIPSALIGCISGFAVQCCHDFRCAVFKVLVELRDVAPVVYFVWFLHKLNVFHGKSGLWIVNFAVVSLVKSLLTIHTIGETRNYLADIQRPDA